MTYSNVVNIRLSIITILMVWVCNSYGQELQQVQNSFNSSQQNVIQEKIFVHNDKSTYIAGEIMWFKLYCVDGTTHKPLNLSKLAYVEVLDDSQVPVLQAKILLKNAIGNGSFNIPLSVTSGNYKLRAYTNWMKNAGPDIFFEKKITIINTLKALPVNVKNTVATYDVQFFPEGGNLVNGINSNIGFKATDMSGKGIVFKGAVVDQRNDTVVRFQPSKFGMGRFSFTPAANNSYRAIIYVANNKPLIKEITVNRLGYVMQLTDASPENITIKINTNTADTRAYLFVHAGQATQTIQSAGIVNGSAQFVISKLKLSDGVSHITVFNTAKQPVCERLYFKRPGKSLLISASTDMQQYTTRKKTALQLTVKDVNGRPLAANLSMAVYRMDSLQTTDVDDITSYLWLSSDLRGNIESPGYYLKTNPADDLAADNLMLTQGWSRFRWADILKNQAPSFTFLPEYNGHIITAKVIDTTTKRPVEGVIGYLAAPGKRVQMYAASSDPAGHLVFNTKDFFGPGEIVVQTNTEVDTTHRIEILNPFAEQYSRPVLPALKITAGMQASLEQASLGMQVHNIYAGNKLKQFYDPRADSTAFFGKPFKSYKLDDYTRFVTMEEVLREYIREVFVSRSQGHFHIKVVSERDVFNSDPLVVLDGIPVFNIDKVMQIDPLKVRKLDVIRQRYFWGPSVYEGILSYTTYKGDLGGVEINPHAVVIDYEGMQLQREFYSPIYQTDSQVKSRLPDMRSLLLWAPDIKTSINAGTGLSFYTSDQTGKYFGLVQGLTANGEAGVQTFTFEVK